MTVSLNGRVIDRFRCTAEETSKTWDVDANGNAPNELVLSTDAEPLVAEDRVFLELEELV